MSNNLYPPPQYIFRGRKQHVFFFYFMKPSMLGVFVQLKVQYFTDKYTLFIPKKSFTEEDIYIIPWGLEGFRGENMFLLLKCFVYRAEFDFCKIKRSPSLTIYFAKYKYFKIFHCIRKQPEQRSLCL